ncbi:MAG: peptidoglycan-binding domain-containing protein [Candidatus Omnitrophota bacterium]
MSKHGFIWFLFIFASIVLLAREVYTVHIYQKDAEARELAMLGNTRMSNKLVANMQNYLINARLNPGSADGVLGWQTRDAIKCFQKTSGLRASGYMDEATWSKLSFYKPGEDTGKTLKKISTAQAAAAPIPKERIPDRKQSEALSIYSKNLVKSHQDVYKIQRGLKKAGFSPGPVDGKLGKRTTAAIRYFQKARGLRINGMVDDKTLQELCVYF